MEFLHCQLMLLGRGRPTDLMSMHIEGIDREIICSEIQGLKDLLQCQVFAISVNDDFLLVSEA
jgi:hypothetical protein